MSQHIIPVITYVPPAIVSEYVARRLVRHELLTVPHLEHPKETDEGGRLIRELVPSLFGRVGMSPAFARRVQARIAAPKGIEGSVAGLRKHCGDVAQLLNAETLEEAREAVKPVHALAEELLQQPPPFEPFGEVDAKVLAAARWFKHTYFRWVDPIKCRECGGETKYTRQAEPQVQERAGSATRVEIHQCQSPSCGAGRRFPRYNDVKALMKSREGRCGEFAQLFYIFHLVLGIEARYVWNSEDHVWTEYWSPALKHWTHVDSCEAETNKPLLYDRGWGKLQRWCLAFGPHGGEDVTRAYVDDWDACLARRMQATEDGNGISEDRLRVLLLTATVQCRARLHPDGRSLMAGMDAAQAEWMENEPRRHAEAEKAGLKGKARESGPREWVEERGEGGASAGEEKTE